MGILKQVTKAQIIKEVTNKYIKIKNFGSSKDTIKGIEKQATSWVKIFVIHITYK